MKICMPPHRCLLSWCRGRALQRGCLSRWSSWQLHGSSGGVFDRRGSTCGPAGVLGKDLAKGPARVSLWHAVIPDKTRGFPWQGSRQGSSSSGSHLILCIYDLYKDLHATTEVPPEPWFQYG